MEIAIIIFLIVLIVFWNHRFKGERKQNGTWADVGKENNDYPSKF